MQPLNILTIGAGMYTLGKNTNGFGTIFPTLSQAQADGQVDQILVAGKSMTTQSMAQSKAAALSDLTGYETQFEVYPKGDDDPMAYIDALDALPDPGAVIVATPDHLHAEMATEAIKRGFPVLVVKPLTPCVDEALSLVELCERENVYGAVEFHKRYDPANQVLKRDLSSGELGDPIQVHVEYSQRITVPTENFISWVSDTNIFQYLGPHYVDIIKWVTNATPERVVATGQETRLRSAGIDTYDAVQAMVEWSLPSGGRFTSTLLTGWIDPHGTSAMSDQSIRFWGTEGRMFSDHKYRGIRKVTEANGVEEINPQFSQFLPALDGSTLRIEGYGPESIRTFIEDARSLNAGIIQFSDIEDCRPTFRDALAATAVVEAVNLSLKRDGKWTPIRNDWEV
jgi:predicted dehydrogenase